MKRMILMAIFIASANIAFSEEPTINIEAGSDKIGLNETLSIQVIIDKRATKVDMPTAPAHTQLAYQGMSTSFNISIVNGRRTTMNNYIYNFVFQADQIGTYVIDSFNVTVDGKTYKTDPLTIEVVKQSQNNSSAAGRTEDFFDQFFGRSRRSFEPEAFLIAQPNVSEVRQNQQMILDVTAYANDESILKSQFVEATSLQSDKFLIYDVSRTLTNTDEIYKQEINGEEYFARHVRRYVCFPVDSGRLAMMPPIFVAVTPYGQMKVRTDKVEINSVQVGRQGGLNYIGNLSATASLSTNVQEVGKVVELKIELTGNGNLKVFSNPYGNFTSQDFFISAPTTEIEMTDSSGGEYIFRETIKYSLIAKHPGDLEIPPLRLDYYDSGMQSQSLTIPGSTIRVIPTYSTNRTLTDMTLKDADTDGRFRFVMFDPVYVALFILSLLMPFASMFYGRHANRLGTDSNYARRFMAGKRFAKYFTDAKRNLDGKNYKDFYLSLQKGLFYFVTDKMSMPSGLGAKEIIEKMTEKKVPGETIDKFREAYELCSQNAYSGRTDENSADEAVEKVRSVFEAIR